MPTASDMPVRALETLVGHCKTIDLPQVTPGGVGLHDAGWGCGASWVSHNLHPITVGDKEQGLSGGTVLKREVCHRAASARYEMSFLRGTINNGQAGCQRQLPVTNSAAKAGSRV